MVLAVQIKVHCFAAKAGRWLSGSRPGSEWAPPGMSMFRPLSLGQPHTESTCRTKAGPLTRTVATQACTAPRDGSAWSSRLVRPAQKAAPWGDVQRP